MIVAGTGHRPNKLGGYTKEAFDKLVAIAESYIKSNPQITKIISGMALGWDQALAQAAINCDIPFLAAIPCYNQDKMWPQKSKDYYNYLLSRATEMVFVTKAEYNSMCMQVRNMYMVHNCDILLALFDGTAGGTSNCIHYAISKNKPVVNLYEQYKQLPH
jgi:uncharacterized phage-like protein YoqJ